MHDLNSAMDTPEKIPVSIVIPTLNEELYISGLLDSILALDQKVDVIVVDGMSTDNTAAVVLTYQRKFSAPASLRLINSERGIALQRNAGAALATYNILIFCDADIIIPSPKAYSKVVAQFKQKNYVAAGVRLVPIERGFRIRLFHAIFYAFQKILFAVGRPYIAGGFLITTKDMFTTIGGFDTRVLLAEDVDYSLRCARFGPCGLINVRFLVSARRLIQYGYLWMLKETPNLVRFLFTGRVIPDTIFYPFGEFGGQEAHYVIPNKEQKNDGHRLSTDS